MLYDAAAWVTRAEVRAADTDRFGDPPLTDSEIDGVLVAAAEFMWATTGRQWPGVNEDRVIRPNSPADAATLVEWGNANTARGTAAMFGAPIRAVLDLGALGRIDAITEVKVDGSPVAGGGYGLAENRYLVRIDGDVWPSRQSLADADTETNTFSVTLDHGTNPPTYAKLGAAHLAGEMARDVSALVDDVELPEALSSLNYENASYQFTTLPTSAPEVDDMLSGLPKATRHVLSLANPNRLTSAPVVIDPDDLNTLADSIT